jgi:quinolinate synthase
MVRFINESNAKRFIVCTEQGLNYRIRKENPDKEIFSPSELNICPNMKKITLEKVRDSLLSNQYEIKLDDEVMDKARIALERMLTI